MKDIQDTIQELEAKLPVIREYLKVPEKKKRMDQLEQQSRSADFWGDPQRAGKVLQEFEDLKKELEEIDFLEKEFRDLAALLEIADNEVDRADLSEKIADLEKRLAQLEFKMLLSGDYDRNDVIITITAGAGGVDAQDWAEMLMRMYLRWAERNDYKAKIIDESRGQEAGIKSATLEIIGAYAYGNLQGDSGVHRLVRLSPFNSDNLRQTSFALVEILPVLDDNVAIEIKTEDLRVDVYRSQGAGGQSVNTTDSAVRITHLPTGIVATCQNERSQMQNRVQAMKILKAKIYQKQQEEKNEKIQEMRGERVSAEWGSQIRSYVLHPYKMVKDHRTKFSVTDAESVLDGNLSSFIESYLKQKIK